MMLKFRKPNEKIIYKKNKGIEVNWYAKIHILFWMRSCWSKGFRFEILEISKNKEDRLKIFTQGRTEEEIIELHKNGILNKDDCNFMLRHMFYSTKISKEKVLYSLDVDNSFMIRPIDCDINKIHKIGRFYGIRCNGSVCRFARKERGKLAKAK